MDQDRGSQPAQDNPRVRAGDAERDAVVEQLRAHHEAGRLDAEEFSERMEAALAARWRDELPPLLADLPGENGHQHEEQDREDATAPPWARGGWGAGPRGGRPWGDRAWGPPWTPRGSRRGPVVPLLPLLAVLAIVASVGAVVHGHFPWPLLWLGLLAWWARDWLVPAWSSRRRPGSTS